MKNKLLKKILGIFEYKLIDKNLFKNNRLLSDKSFLTINIILKNIFEKKKINNLIQIGANDGDRFDILNYYIKKYQTKSLLVEPIKQNFEQLKKKLEMEGLFNSVNKKQLPFLPSTVGIVTSPQGAALQDMIKILRQRMPKINILLSPTPVQGKGSATAIAQAINRLDKAGLCDIIIVGRGGGSLEDLWAFNEEVVVRSLAKCKTPTISAVGHETDITIADLAADQRASTPSHAAQKAVPLLVDLLANIKRHHRTIHRIESERLLAAKAELALQQSNLLRLSTFLWSAHQKLDQLRIRLDFSKIRASGIQRVLFLK